MKSLLVPMLSCGLMVGCGAESVVWEGVIDTIGGTRVVENPMDGLAAEGELTVRATWSQAGPADGAVWELPEALRVGNDEIYVIDPPAGRVQVVGRGGDLRDPIGQRGQGPGEYGRLIDAIPTEVGLFVVDGGNARIDVLDEARRVVASHPAGRVIFEAVPWGGDGILTRGLIETEAVWQSFDGSGPGHVVALPGLPLIPSEEGGACARTASSGSTLVLLRCHVPDIGVFAADGEIVERFTVPFEPQLVTDDEIEVLVQSARALMQESGLPDATIETMVSQIRGRPRTKGSMRKVVIDDEGGLIGVWQQNPEDYGSGPATVHFLSSSGVYLTSVDFEQAWSDFDMADATLYALAREPGTDQVGLVAFEIQVAPGLRSRIGSLE